MPNWCENTLKIQGKSKDIYDFCKKHIVDGMFDFNTYIPEPKTEKECPDRYNLNINPDRHVGPNSDGKLWFNWYKWRNYYWGCKWNSCCLSGKNLPDLDKSRDEYHENTCEITFLTPWGPPIDIFEEIIWCDYIEKLRIKMFYSIEGDDENYFYDETESYGVKKYTKKWSSKPSQILAFLDNQFKIINDDDNVFIFTGQDFNGGIIEDDNFDELKEVVLENPNCTCNAGGDYNVILADLRQKYSGIKNIDHQNSFDLAYEVVSKSLELCSKNTNLVFNVATSTPVTEKLILLLKNKFKTVKRIKPPMVAKRSSEMFVVCLKYQINDYDLEGELKTLIE